MSYTRGPGVAHWHSIDTVTSGLAGSIGTLTATAWSANNRAVYMPVIVRERIVVTKLWVGNGIVGTGNYDVGLYDAAGTAILRRGSTAKTAATTELVWDCTDTTIGPGLYYLALAAASTGDYFATVSMGVAPLAAAYGLLIEESAMPLPATATFSLAQTLAQLPVVGMLRDTRVS